MCVYHEGGLTRQDKTSPDKTKQDKILNISFYIDITRGHVDIDIDVDGIGIRIGITSSHCV